MGRQALTNLQIDEIVGLRQTGHSLPEITRLTKHGYSTVFKYIKNITPLPRYTNLLKQKQGGSKERARQAWQEAREHAKSTLLPLKNRDLLLLLLGLYWGEGTKRELSVINSDPRMIAIFVKGFHLLGIPSSQIIVSLRLFPDMDLKSIKRFWGKIVGVDPRRIKQVYHAKPGKDKNRLQYGMCRLRVIRSARHFKLLMSLLEVFIESYCPRSSTDRTAAS